MSHIFFHLKKNCSHNKHLQYFVMFILYAINRISKTVTLLHITKCLKYAINKTKRFPE